VARKVVRELVRHKFFYSLVRHQKGTPVLFGMFNRKKVALTAERSGWPYPNPRNEAVITIDSIVSGEKPIRRVVHDASDGGWQFLTGEEVEAHQARVVSLLSITELDPTVMSVADLPEGWYAERPSVAEEWERWPAE
jgi:hypothetical protein